MTDKPFYTDYPIHRYQPDGLAAVDDVVVEETEITIVLNGQLLVALACSPRAYPELAVGYLLAEGWLNRFDQLESLEVKENQVWIEADAAKSIVVPDIWHINTCLGRCQSNTQGIKPVDESSSRFKPEHLLTLAARLNEESPVFKKTGGTHIAGLGQEDNLVVSYEDIGRHNAVDKTLGFAFLQKVSLQDKCLALSGRIAGEILLKAARSGIGLILSRSAPTSKTVSLAEQLGITIVGFARGNQFNVYTYPERVLV
ncbi:MAG: formate dehydrogenase accessory sulfurtransferase FdhD [Methylocystaceae bacterium]